MLKTKTITAAELVGGMNIVIPERPDMFVSIVDIDYPSHLIPGMIFAETEIGTVYLDKDKEVLIEDNTAGGVVIDAESIRFELQESGDLYEMEPDTLGKLFSLSHEEINDAIHENLNDDFWSARNALISDVIASLVEKVEG